MIFEKGTVARQPEPGTPPTRVTRENVAMAALLVACLLTSLWLAGIRPHRAHEQAAAPVAALPPKAAAERWLLQTWLPTVRRAPYGATDRCVRTRSVFKCWVRITADASPLPRSRQKVYRLTVRPPTSYRVRPTVG